MSVGKLDLNAAFTAALANQEAQPQAAGNKPVLDGAVKVPSELVIRLGNLEPLMDAFDASIGGTAFGQFAAQRLDGDPTRTNYSYGWVSLWTAFAATKVAENEGVTGFLEETSGGHRRAQLSSALVHKIAGGAIAAAKARRMVNFRVGPPNKLKACDPIFGISPDYSIADTQLVWELAQAPCPALRGAVVPAGLGFLFMDGVLVKDREIFDASHLYAGESEVVKAMLASYQSNVGYWSEARKSSALATGDILWGASTVEDVPHAWSTSQAVLESRTTYTDRAGWHCTVLDTSDRIEAMKANIHKQAMKGGSTRRS